MDPKLLELLEKAAANLSNGKCYGLAVIQVLKQPDGQWGIDAAYHGPLLNLMAGCNRLSHGLNRGMDQIVPLPAPDVSS